MNGHYDGYFIFQVRERWITRYDLQEPVSTGQQNMYNVNAERPTSAIVMPNA